jgi:hypothetical protein
MLIPISPFEFPFRRYIKYNYAGTRFETHRWANMRKQYLILGGECTRTRSQPSMQTTQWWASNLVSVAGSISKLHDLLTLAVCMEL